MIEEIASTESRPADPQHIELFLEGVKDYAIILLDSQGAVLSWNDGAALMFGYNPAEVIGRSFSHFSTPEDIRLDKSAQELRQAEALGQVTREHWQIRKDGSRFWGCAITTALRDERGELKGFAKVLRDTTDRKHLEMELRRQAEELAEANRRKDEFLAMLSHELRNPLAPVLNSVQVLRQAPHDPNLVEFAGSLVERQVLHMARLIDDLLDVTRLTHGKVQIRKEPVELVALARRSAECVQPLMCDRKHEFRVNVSDRPIWIEGDPVRLDQILVNLLNNAAEFTEPGGRIELSVERTDSEAVIRVQDDGIGIAEDLLPRVFDLFAQADTSLDRSRGGCGIGLTLVKGLVAMHDGSVEVRSEGRGRGSEFIVRLPAMGDSPRELRATVPPEPNHRALRILVVDDNIDMACSLRILLELRGHEVQAAHDGISALDAAFSRSFDAILLDIGLPGIDGFEVANRIRQRGGEDRPVLIGISGYGFDADQKRAGEAGFDLYLVKPADPQLLEKQLAELTASRDDRLSRIRFSSGAGSPREEGAGSKSAEHPIKSDRANSV